MTPLFRLAAPVAAFALLAAPATAAAPAKKKTVAAAQANRTATGSKALPSSFARAVIAVDGGHILGNPEAANQLTEYMSYTCSHCYEFSKEGDPAIRLLLVPKGNVSYEIRHSLRDIVDLTAAMLTNCGDADRFPANHDAMISHQPEWMARAQKATQAQMTRWNNGTLSTRLRAIASDLGFYDLMEPRGYTRTELDRCLSDEAKANAMAETSARDNQRLGLKGTPSFTLNGKLLDGVYSWDALKPVLEKLD